MNVWAKPNKNDLDFCFSFIVLYCWTEMLQQFSTITEKLKSDTLKQRVLLNGRFKFHKMQG